MYSRNLVYSVISPLVGATNWNFNLFSSTLPARAVAPIKSISEVGSQPELQKVTQMYFAHPFTNFYIGSKSAKSILNVRPQSHFSRSCFKATYLKYERAPMTVAAATGGGRAKGGIHPGRYCAGAAFEGAEIFTSEILHPKLSVLFTVHTNAIVITIRISIGDLIAGVGRQQKRLPRAANTLAPPLSASTLTSWQQLRRTSCYQQDFCLCAK